MKTSFCLILSCQVFVAAPLHSKNKIMGVITADNTFNRPITDESIEIPRTFADQANLMIANSRTHAQMEEQLITVFEESHERLFEVNKRLLKVVERMTELSKSVKLLTHEIENSLTVVGGFARRLYNNLPDGDARKEEAAIILNEMKQLEAMLKIFSNNLPIETDEEAPGHKIDNVSEAEAPRQYQSNNEGNYSETRFYLRRMKPQKEE